MALDPLFVNVNCNVLPLLHELWVVDVTVTAANAEFTIPTMRRISKNKNAIWIFLDFFEKQLENFNLDDKVMEFHSAFKRAEFVV